MIPTNGRKSKQSYAAFVGVLVVFVVGAIFMVSLLRLVDSMGPQTGDIISFPVTRVTSVSPAAITVSRTAATGGMSCTLDVQTMEKSGGSLVVESTRLESSRIFQVHWAGARTSNGREDCGNSADLLLNSYQITALVFAAGGMGVKESEANSTSSAMP